jgi:hypothetical protein
MGLNGSCGQHQVLVGPDLDGSLPGLDNTPDGLMQSKVQGETAYLGEHPILVHLPLR